MSLYKRIVPTLMILIMLAGSCANQSESSQSKNNTSGIIKWLSFNEGWALAQKQKKPMLVDFFADWCKWCIVMDKETFTDYEVAQKLNESYITVRVYTDKTDGEKLQYKGKSFTNQEFATGMGIQGLPTLLFFDKKGNPITKIPGFIKKDMLMPILDYISTECYNKNITFDDFVSKKGICGKK